MVKEQFQRAERFLTVTSWAPSTKYEKSNMFFFSKVNASHLWYPVTSTTLLNCK